VRALLVVVCLTALLMSPAAMAITARSGRGVADLDSYVPRENGVPFDPRGNVLMNGDFETGALAPWTTNAWVITGGDFHGGAFSAEAVANTWLYQEFDPIAVGGVLSISMWSKQPAGAAFQAVDLFYGPSDFDEFLVGPGVDWTFIDMTSEMRPTGTLMAIRIWGYEDSAPGDDVTRVDDVFIDHIASPVETATWGLIKAIYR
jgi:hypothetical protein